MRYVMSDDMTRDFEGSQCIVREQSCIYVRIRFEIHQHKVDIVLADSSVTAGAVIIFN